MKNAISAYNTLVFDCDGVILNSNGIKTDAFYQAALPYGEPAAQALREYHVANGGISRYHKFQHFLDKIVPSGTPGPSINDLLDNFAAEVKRQVANCEVASGLRELRERTSHTRWLIVSGGDQAELRALFTQRNLSDLFEGGIFGSPDTKESILARELNNGNIRHPALFLGDSRYDYKAAQSADIDFLFISGWSEVTDWREWTSENGIESWSCVADLYVD